MDIVTSKIALTEKPLSRAEIKARAGEIFMDATQIEPVTAEGMFARREAQKQAQHITQLSLHNVELNVDYDVVSELIKQTSETATSSDFNTLAMKHMTDTEHVPLTSAYQKTWIDTANFIASDIARSEGLTGQELTVRATEIFKDAACITPKTNNGEKVRSVAQLEAQFQSKFSYN